VAGQQDVVDLAVGVRADLGQLEGAAGLAVGVVRKLERRENKPTWETALGAGGRPRRELRGVHPGAG
jgi:hypothetical protein